MLGLGTCARVHEHKFNLVLCVSLQFFMWTYCNIITSSCLKSSPKNIIGRAELSSPGFNPNWTEHR